MPSIETRLGPQGRLSYRCKVRLKGAPTQHATFDKISDARRWGAQVEAAIREGRYFKTSEAKKHTVAELIDRYLKEIMPLKPKPGKNTIQQLGWWRAELGVYTLADATPQLISEKRNKLSLSTSNRGKLFSPSTVGRYMAALSHVLTIAVNEWGWLDDNPMRKVTRPKESRGRVRFLNDDERARLFAACKASKCKHLYPAVILAISTGARRMEILGLHWNDINFDRKLITINDSKNGDRRNIHLGSYALDTMRQHATNNRLTKCNLVFPGRRLKKPIDLQFPFADALEAAGIFDFRWHDLRHSCASYLAMNGATLTEIAEILGHKSFQMVKRYTHLSDTHTSDVLDKMTNKMFDDVE